MIQQEQEPRSTHLLSLASIESRHDFVNVFLGDSSIKGGKILGSSFPSRSQSIPSNSGFHPPRDSSV
jgi:hypothetical protein